MKNIFLIVFISIGLTGCFLFETRTPELPDQSSGNFIPPTSPDIVLENFTQAIKNKNADHYEACFIDSGYTFIPSSDANTQFPSFFQYWTIANEKRYFIALTTQLGQSNTFNIELINKNYETITADSVVLVADYSIFVELPLETYPTTYEGKLLLTITPTNFGLWAISRWQDFQLNTANSKETFSFLKAYFHN